MAGPDQLLQAPAPERGFTPDRLTQLPEYQQRWVSMMTALGHGLEVATGVRKPGIYAENWLEDNRFTQLNARPDQQELKDPLAQKRNRILEMRKAANQGIILELSRAGKLADAEALIAKMDGDLRTLSPKDFADFLNGKYSFDPGTLTFAYYLNEDGTPNEKGLTILPTDLMLALEEVAYDARQKGNLDLSQQATAGLEFLQKHTDIAITDNGERKTISFLNFKGQVEQKAISLSGKNESEFNALSDGEKIAFRAKAEQELINQYQAEFKFGLGTEPDFPQETIDGWSELARKADEPIRKGAKDQVRASETASTQQEAIRLQSEAFRRLAATVVLGPGEIPDDLKPEWDKLSPGARNSINQYRLAAKLAALNEINPDSELVTQIKKELGGENLTVEEICRNSGIDLFDQACQARGLPAITEEQKSILGALEVDPSKLASASPDQIIAIFNQKLRGSDTILNRDEITKIINRLQTQEIQGTLAKWLFGTTNPEELTDPDFKDLFNKTFFEKASKLFSWPFSDWKNGMCLATTLSMLFPEIMSSLLSEEGGKRSSGMG